MLGRLLLTYSVIRKKFHKYISPLFTFLLFVNLRINVAVGMFLDKIFFPSLKKTQVKSPIVIVGNPRTGTTFLHRFLTSNGMGTGFQLYGMLFPSLILRALVKPFLPLIEKVSPARHHAAAAHKTSLVSVETDDVSMFFRYFDGFFLYGFFMAWDEQDRLDEFDPSKRDTSPRDFAYLEKIWRRNLVATKGDRVVGKLFSLGPRVNPFLERFPDAKLLYTVRDPLAFVPSGMSLVTGVLDQAFGYWKLPEEERNKYTEKLYMAFLQLSRSFHDDWVSGKLPRENVMVVSFDRMMQDFEGLMEEMMPFIGVEPDEALVEEIKSVGAKQRAYKSKHKYDFDRFNLDPERIKEDFGFIYETFGIKPAL